MENLISEAVSFVSQKWGQVWLVVTSVVTIASVIVKLTKTTKDDNILAKILWIVSLNKAEKAKK